MRPGTCLGAGGTQEWWLGFEYRRHVWLSERCPQTIAKFAVQRGRPDLHQHVRAVVRPSDLLFLDHPLANKRIYRRLGEGRSDAKIRLGSAFHS